MTQDVFNLGISEYEHAVGLDEMERDSEGFIILKPTAKRVDEKKSELTTSISDLEAKLKKFKEERSMYDKIQKTEEYKESKKKMSKKKAKKKKSSLLEMVFNNADAASDEVEDEESEDGTYRDSRKSKAKTKKSDTTLETTYGKRFSPIVSMLHDTIVEFDDIASDIEAELKNARNQSKTMYRSAQMGNLLSAKKNKFDAIKELAAVAKTLSDLEYKKEKDKKSEEGVDSTKAISAIGAKYLRGSDIFGSDKDKKKKGKKSDKKSKDYDDDDEDEDVTGTIKKQREEDQRALAVEFAKTLQSKKGDISLTPHERYIALEGKFETVIVADPTDPDGDWKFIALDVKTGKEIKGFKDDYPGLLPKKKNCRMVFDLSRLRAMDKNSSRTYKLILKN